MCRKTGMHKSNLDRIFSSSACFFWGGIRRTVYEVYGEADSKLPLNFCSHFPSPWCRR